MLSKRRRWSLTLWLFAVVCVLSSLLLGSANAKKPPKTYPEEGKIVGTGTLEHQVGYYSHTYTLETSSKRLWLDCPHGGSLFQHVGSECGGKEPIKVGDVVHFRVEKDWLYVLVTRDVYDDAKHDLVPKEDEEKLRILNEELKPAASDKAQAPAPGKAEPDASTAASKP